MLFLIVGFVCLVLMLFTKRSYLFGGISLASFFLYFIYFGNGTWLTFLLFLAGLLLLILEIFIPDFGLIGVMGLLSLMVGYFLNRADFWGSIFDLSLAVIIAAITGYVLVKKGYRLLPGRADLVLNTSLHRQKGYAPSRDYTLFLGKTGKTLTSLRPSGKAEISGKTLDVISDGKMIPAGANVQVIHVEGIKIIVKEL